VRPCILDGVREASCALLSCSVVEADRRSHVVRRLQTAVKLRVSCSDVGEPKCCFVKRVEDEATEVASFEL
jgi:hypothetical protein